MSEIKPIPDHFIGVVPHIVVKGVAQALEFYQAALGAKVAFALPMPGTDTMMHAEIQLSGNTIMLAEENEAWEAKSPAMFGGSPVTLHYYVENVDAALAQALAAGATLKMPATDMFWGDRYAMFIDPFGHTWSLATHISDPTPEEMAAAMAQMGGPCPE